MTEEQLRKQVGRNSDAIKDLIHIVAIAILSPHLADDAWKKKKAKKVMEIYHEYREDDD